MFGETAIEQNTPPAFRLMLTLRRAGVSDARVLAAFDQYSRADFVDPAYADLAHEDVPIPLPCGQVSLKPSVLAAMLEALHIAPDQCVLVVGAGTGYSAAVLSRLASEVVALERFHTLRRAMEANIARAGLSNVSVHLADGYVFQSALKFDRVLITGAVDAPPPALLRALTAGGVLVAPLSPGAGGRIAAFRAAADGGVTRADFLEVDIPPLEPGVAQFL